MFLMMMMMTVHISSRYDVHVEIVTYVASIFIGICLFIKYT